MIHRLLCKLGYCTSPSHKLKRVGEEMIKEVEKTLPPLHGGYKPRPGPDGKYRDISTPPKPPKGPGGSSK